MSIYTWCSAAISFCSAALCINISFYDVIQFDRMLKSLCVDCPHCGQSFYGASCRKAMHHHIALKHIDKICVSDGKASHIKDMKKPKNIKKKKRNRSESPMSRETYSISWKLRRVIEYQKVILCKQAS